MLDTIQGDDLFYNQIYELDAKAQKIKFDILYKPLKGKLTELQDFTLDIIKNDNLSNRKKKT